MKLVIEKTFNDNELASKLMEQVMELADQIEGFAIQMIEGFIKLPKGTEIAWTVKLHRLKGPEGDWYGCATCTANLVTPFKTVDGDVVMVPVTEVSDVHIEQNYSRDGFRWGWHNHNHFKLDCDMVKDIATALVKGKLPSGFHYRCNQFPNLS